MDQLSVITDEISQNFDHSLSVAAKFGIKAVDIRTIWKKNIALFSNEELDELKQILSKHNMKVNVITSPFAKCVLPSSNHASQKSRNLRRNPTFNLNLFDRIVEISDFFETPYIRIFSFLCRASKLTENKWKEMMDYLQPYIEKAEDIGKILLLENDFGLIIASIENTKRFFEEINSGAIKLVLDPGNFFMEGDSTNPADYDHFYQNGLVEHIHVKDPIRRIPGIGANFTIVGEGKIDYLELFKQAIDFGYKGHFSLETHVLKNKEEVSTKSLKNMSEWIKMLS